MMHERLQPETIGIIGAMEAEVHYLKNALSDVHTYTFGKSVTIYTGNFSNKYIALCQSGIGKVNAALATTLLIEHFTPDCFFNTGSAGGIGKGLRVGDVVIGTHTAHHDVNATAFGYQVGQVPQLPICFASHSTLIQAAETSAEHWGNARISRGLIVSGDQFINNQAAIDNVTHHFPNAQAVEMEAAAIAQTCYQLEIAFVVIRAISDNAQEKASMSFEQFLNKAASHSAQMVQAMIRTL